MITNNTFLTNDGKKQLRNFMISNGLYKLINYPKPFDIFEDVQVACCIWIIRLENKSKHEFQYDKIIDRTLISQYKTVLRPDSIIYESYNDLNIQRKMNSDKNMQSILYGEKTFGIQTKGRKGFSGGEDIVKYSKEHFDNAVNLMCNFDNDGEHKVYTTISEIPQNRNLVPDHYKVVCPRVVTKKQVQALDKVTILGYNYACTQHWQVISITKDLSEAENICKYIKTRMFKYLIQLFSQDGVNSLNSQLMSHVPLQDFTSSSDIDWSKSIDDIDKQLYRKYNLTQEEIDYIEKTIKPMK